MSLPAKLGFGDKWFFSALGVSKAIAGLINYRKSSIRRKGFMQSMTQKCSDEVSVVEHGPFA